MAIQLPFAFRWQTGGSDSALTDSAPTYDLIQLNTDNSQTTLITGGSLTLRTNDSGGYLMIGTINAWTGILALWAKGKYGGTLTVDAKTVDSLQTYWAAQANVLTINNANACANTSTGILYVGSVPAETVASNLNSGAAATMPTIFNSGISLPFTGTIGGRPSLMDARHITGAPVKTLDLTFNMPVDVGDCDFTTFLASNAGSAWGQGTHTATQMSSNVIRLYDSTWADNENGNTYGTSGNLFSKSLADPSLPDNFNSMSISAAGAITIQAGTGAGQLDFTAGVVKANLWQILGATITGTAAYLVAAFTKFFNIASSRVRSSSTSSF